MRKWGSVLYTARPPANRRGARLAWDILSCPGHAKGRRIVGMFYAFMDYWVWVAEYDDGEYEEVDGLILRGEFQLKEQGR